MDCQEFQNQLDQLIENRLDITSDVAEHGATCSQSECQERWIDFVLLESAISAWKEQIPVIDLKDQILNAEQFDEVEVLPQPPRLTNTTAMFTTVAACVAVCALVAVLAIPRLNWSIPGNAVAQANQNVSDKEELQELGKMYASMVHDASQKMTATVDNVLPDMDQMMENMGPSASLLNIWSERLEPIEQEFDEKLENFLRETVSTMDEQTS